MMVEIEMRAIVDENFLKRLEGRCHLSVTKAYGLYVDDYYKPRGASPKDFDPNFVTLRTRKLSSKNDELTIILDKVSYESGLKRSVYGGKIVVFKGPEDVARDILETLDFEYWFSVKKLEGKEYSVVDERSGLSFKFYLEDVSGIGNMIEIEFKSNDAEANADKIVDLIGIEKKNIINKSIASFVAERLGLIEA